MALSEYELLVQLQGRILAQEMFMRTVLTAAFMNTPEPLAALEEMRSDQVRTANVAVRPTGKYENLVWEAGVATVHNELDQIANRLRDQLAASATPVFRQDEQPQRAFHADGSRERAWRGPEVASGR
jgi:hypothetical protein